MPSGAAPSRAGLLVRRAALVLLPLLSGHPGVRAQSLVLINSTQCTGVNGTNCTFDANATDDVEPIVLPPGLPGWFAWFAPVHTQSDLNGDGRLDLHRARGALGGIRRYRYSSAVSVT